MNIVAQIKNITATAINDLYQFPIDAKDILINATKPEFTGDYTVVLFSFVKQLKKSPEALGNELGNYLVEKNNDLIKEFNVIKGFLNLSISDSFWIDFLKENSLNKSFGQAISTNEKIMVEYSSPNTNKPLHLGHLRNNFLGYSIAEILKANGNEVISSCVVNDRGIHICKSMIAWQMFANGATPQSTNTKGDHFVGDYYVKFNDEYKQQIKELVAQGKGEDEAEKEAPIMRAAQQMLFDWEAGKPDVIELWKKMNGWVYEGFDETYKLIGTKFDKVYYESNTYLLGKDLVEDGLRKNVFYQKEDGSVWIDLTNDGLDEKLVRRKDGTSVYITQDIGLAEQKQKEFGISQSIYVVGDEQNYHFKVLKLICQKLGLPSADGIEHLSYGMVELPSGKMKSREGTVVDADDIVQEMMNIAQQKTEELGKVKDFSEDELLKLYHTLGLGALKFFLLRVHPKKKMIFNPEESIDFHGFTGPFVQYTYARIQSILRKVSGEKLLEQSIQSTDLLPQEKDVITHLEQFPVTINESATEQDPSKLAIYVFNLAKTFNQFYTDLSIANAESLEKKILRVQLAQLAGNTIKKAMSLLGIDVPERM
ncbi:arginine--tRNA ligase [Arachidicoccus ginsenosidimutans]|uniref:arginine--tRNA ligase n=1 Tax=Arachidicoccus sp. BS20 TaxID=1850526 RepID=UPI0007F179F8|nr:arginine--tRNA ligase [Arachidicoccus sp. BS20]ANI90295.1 arginine--tRNA ligase [Arachidicoccus sp. BS20]